MRKVHRAYLGFTRIWHCGVYTKTDSTGESTRQWEESDICRLTANATIFFQKAYLSSLQVKNGQICVPYLHFWKIKCFRLQGGASPPNTLTRGSAPGPCWGLRPHIPHTPVVWYALSARHQLPLLWRSLRLTNLSLTVFTHVLRLRRYERK